MCALYINDRIITQLSKIDFLKSLLQDEIKDIKKTRDNLRAQQNNAIINLMPTTFEELLSQSDNRLLRLSKFQKDNMTLTEKERVKKLLEFLSDLRKYRQFVNYNIYPSIFQDIDILNVGRLHLKDKEMMPLYYNTLNTRVNKKLNIADVVIVIKENVFIYPLDDNQVSDVLQKKEEEEEDKIKDLVFQEITLRCHEIEVAELELSILLQQQKDYKQKQDDDDDNDNESVDEYF